jgi:hypothetical protein
MVVQESMAFSVDSAARLVRLRAFRDHTFAELKATIAAVLADPEYRPGFSVLADCSAIMTAPTSEYVRGVVSLLATHAADMPGARWAQVVQPGATYGMARMAGFVGAEALGDYRVFSDVEEAERWLAERPANRR